MTDKEAITVLKNHISPYDDCMADNEVNQAIRLAIKALEERPQGDLISRKQVLKELMAHQYSQDFCKEHGIEYSINSSMVRIIVNRAQTVEPEKIAVANVTFDKEQLEEIVEKAKDEVLAVALDANERPQGEWIPISEKLPDERDWYLGLFKEPDTGFIGIPYICDYVGEITKGTTKEGWILRHCTDVDNASDYFRNLICVAWQPLPEPYKKGGAE